MIFDYNSFNNKSINESISRQNIKDLIEINLDDELIRYNIQEGYYSMESYNRKVFGEVWGFLFKKPVTDTDRFCYMLQIDLWNNEEVDLKVGNGYSLLNCIEGGIIDAIHNISKSTDTKVVFLKSMINIFIFTDEEINKVTDPLELLYNEIRSRYSNSTSDYANWTTVKLEDDKIVIKTNPVDEYSNRKFKFKVKGLKLDDYDVKQEETEDDSGNFYSDKYHVTTITRK